MIKIILGAMIGAAVGYLWYRFVGCQSDSCYIMRHRLLAVLYWAIFGGLLANLL